MVIEDVTPPVTGVPATPGRGNLFGDATNLDSSSLPLCESDSDDLGVPVKAGLPRPQGNSIRSRRKVQIAAEAVIPIMPPRRAIDKENAPPTLGAPRGMLRTRSMPVTRATRM